jgi:hypothetical protein
MGDTLTIEHHAVTLTTEEGQTIRAEDSCLEEMIRQEVLPPLGDEALPDGVKFFEYHEPFFVVVHQLPPHVRRLRWITSDSPAAFGPEATYRSVRISIPYVITFAVFYRCARGLAIAPMNELYFRNEPLRSRDDPLGFPALLNISAISAPARWRSWICTQYLQTSSKSPWTQQLSALLEHTWNGGFNLSSEQHEGASWYGKSQDVHADLHPVERWESATTRNEAFALTVPWKPVEMNVGQLMSQILRECREQEYSHLIAGDTQRLSLARRFLKFIRSRARHAR